MAGVIWLLSFLQSSRYKNCLIKVKYFVIFGYLKTIGNFHGSENINDQMRDFQHTPTN